MKRHLVRSAVARKSRLPSSRLKLTDAPGTVAGSFVYRRYRVPATIADLIATLAGLGGNREGLQ